MNIRKETCQIIMRLNKTLCEKHRETAKTVKVLPNDVLEGDILKLSYEFTIHYYGEIVERLKAVNKICSDPDVVIDVNCELLEESKCLVYEALKNLEKLIKTVKGR